MRRQLLDSPANTGLNVNRLGTYLWELIRDLILVTLGMLGAVILVWVQIEPLGTLEGRAGVEEGRTGESSRHLPDEHRSVHDEEL